MSIKNIIRMKMLAKGISQTKLIHEVHMAQTTLSDWFKNRRGIKYETLLKICAYLDIHSVKSKEVLSVKLKK